MLRNGRILRAVNATTIVAAIGAVGGALGGIAVAAEVLIVQVFRVGGLSSSEWDNLSLFVPISGVTMAFGALYGVVLGPLYAWTMLRRAPLWRAIGETAAAAAIGVGLGISSHWIYGEFVLPVLLSTAAAVRLNLEMRRRRELSTLPRVSDLELD